MMMRATSRFMGGRSPLSFFIIISKFKTRYCATGVCNMWIMLRVGIEGVITDAFPL